MRACHTFLGALTSTAAILALTGCAPLSAKRGIDSAAQLVETARAENAEKYARYEYTKSALYLEQARERSGYGDYEIATEYATVSADLAKTAGQIARQRRDLERRRGKPDVPSATDPVDPTAPVLVPGVIPSGDPPPKRTFLPPPSDEGGGKKKLLPPGMGGGQ